MECSGVEYYAYTFSLMLPIVIIWAFPIPFMLFYGIRSASKVKLSTKEE